MDLHHFAPEDSEIPEHLEPYLPPRHRRGFLISTDSEEQSKILADAVYERRRQIQKWGPQRHPDIAGEDSSSLFTAAERTANRRAAFAEEAHRFKAINDRRERLNIPTSWADIWLEEIYEALETDNPADLRKELIESIAVAVAWIEDLDTRGSAGTCSIHEDEALIWEPGGEDQPTLRGRHYCPACQRSLMNALGRPDAER